MNLQIQEPKDYRSNTVLMGYRLVVVISVAAPKITPMYSILFNEVSSRSAPRCTLVKFPKNIMHHDARNAVTFKNSLMINMFSQSTQQMQMQAPRA